MIRSFKDREAEKIFEGRFSRKLPQSIQRTAARKLEQLNAASLLETLRVLPGEILLEDFLKPMEMSQYHLARSMGVPPRRINEIVHGKRGVTADTALRMGRFFGMEAQFWMNLQTRYDLETTREALADRLEQEVQLHTA
jgi:addiction module HigA family antidote